MILALGKRRIANNIARAQSYQITLKPDIRSFVECALRYGDDFALNEDSRWAKAILDSEHYGTEKIEAIRNYKLFDLQN